MSLREEVVHFITADSDGKGNVTACGHKLVYPMRGNGWRVRDVTCPTCDKVVCDMAHTTIRALAATGDEG